MFKTSIDEKPFFTLPTGEEVRDLTQTIFELKNRNYISYNVYKVPKEYRMRPDLIAKSVYNNSIYAEIILKYNGISNPFSIDEGDVILIPDLDSAKQKMKKPGGTEADKAQKIRDSYKFIDPLKKPTKGDDLKKFDERDIPRDALPPNISRQGDRQVNLKNGRAYFGSRGANNCLEDGISASEFLTTVITNRNRRK
jgi:hypothetical protein